MEHALRPVLGLDDDVGLGEAALDVAALGHPGVADERVARHGLVGIEERLEDVPLDGDQLQRRLRLVERVRGDRGDGLARIVRLVRQRAEHGANAG